MLPVRDDLQPISILFPRGPSHVLTLIDATSPAFDLTFRFPICLATCRPGSFISSRSVVINSTTICRSESRTFDTLVERVLA